MGYQEGSVITVTAAGGGAGTSTGTATSTESFSGALWGYYVAHTAAPATTVIKGWLLGGPGGADVLLFTAAASNTDGLRVPRIASQKASDGAASTFYEPIPLNGRKLKITVATTDVGAVIKVYPIVQV